MLFTLSWRNIWRNRRRTLITAASILFAVLFAAFMEALQKGAWNHMIDNIVNYYYGYVQIHEAGYWEEKSINKAFALTDSLDRLDQTIDPVRAVVPRIESFALASVGPSTTGALVVGIDPEKENRMTQLRDRIEAGEYLKGSDRAVLMAEGLAGQLELGIGDTLVLISQGYHGVNAAGKYPVKGLVHFGSPELNKQMVYLPLPEAQWFYGAAGLVTSLALQLDDRDNIPEATRALRDQLDASRYEIMDWREMMPELVRAKALDSAGNIIVYIILYLIIAFGIFGTILMMTKEREYEFGILISIGMQRWRLAFSVWLETIMIGLLGAFLGILASVPIVWHFHHNPLRFPGQYAQALEAFGFEPIFPTEFDFNIFFAQALLVFLLTSVLALYPIRKIYRMHLVEAMRD